MFASVVQREESSSNKDEPDCFSRSVVSFTCMTFYSESFGSLKGFESANKVMSMWVSTDAGRCHSHRARTTGESGSAERGEREGNEEATEEEGETELLQDVKKKDKEEMRAGKSPRKLVPSTWVDKLVGRCCFVEWVRFQSCWCVGGCFVMFAVDSSTLGLWKKRESPLSCSSLLKCP